MKPRIDRARGQLFLNLLFALYHGLLGIFTASWWLITAGAYYGALSIVRFAVLSSKKENGVFVMRMAGGMFCFLSVILIGTVYMTLFYRESEKYHEIVMITMALYAFIKMTLAIIHYTKDRKSEAPEVTTLRSLAVADAVVSMFTLQRSMLVSFEGMTPQETVLMNALTGTAVWITLLLFGINLITKRGFFKMAKSKLVKKTEKIAEGVTGGFQKISDGVVGGYKKIETGVVDGYTKIEDKFVDTFLTKEGETVEEAKKRLKKQ